MIYIFKEQINIFKIYKEKERQVRNTSIMNLLYSIWYYNELILIINLIY